jgi:short chain dehydrogenase
VRLSILSFSLKKKENADFFSRQKINKIVNNVGVSHEFPTDFVDTSPEELATIINVNVTATLRVTSLIAPSMASRFVRLLPSSTAQHILTHIIFSALIISKKGLILNMGSFAGAAPTPMLAVYSASKSFLRTWSEGLTAELAPKGVIVEHVNTYYVVRSPPFLVIRNNNNNKINLPTHTDFGNVENPPFVAVYSHPKSFCAHRSREDRTGHHHALLDSCARQRCHGARAVQGGVGVHARSVEEYEETCISKTGEACKARIDIVCLTDYHVYNNH